MASDNLTDLNKSKAKIATIVVAVLLPISWLSVVLRLWVRARLTRSVGWDDGVMVFTLMLFTVYCAFLLVLVSNGGFSHLLDPGNNTILYVLLAEAFYVLTTIVLKVALGLFFLRIVIMPWQKYTFYGILAVSTGYGFFYFFVAIFQCGIPSNFLESKMSGQGCMPNSVFFAAGYTYSAISIIADWTFVILPIFMLKGANMDRRTKFSVGVIIALGAIGSVSTTLRMVFLKGIGYGKDFFYEAANVTIWSTIEPGTGITACSIATLRPLMRRAVEHARRTLVAQPSHTGRLTFSSRSNSSNRERRRDSHAGFHPFDDEDPIVRNMNPFVRRMGCGGRRGRQLEINDTESLEDVELRISRKGTEETVEDDGKGVSIKSLTREIEMGHHFGLRDSGTANARL